MKNLFLYSDKLCERCIILFKFFKNSKKYL